MNQKLKVKFVFFGTGNFAVKVLDALYEHGFTPELIVAMPDKPKGRKMILTPPPVKIWAAERGISVEQPQKLSDISGKLKDEGYDLFMVAEFGKIIPKEILEIPKRGALNVHPSLLPKLRGPSPIQSAILAENETGVTIILLDEEMDHGPILAQQKWEARNPKHEITNKFKIQNLNFKTLQEELAKLGGELLAEVIPKWIAGKIKPKEQEHNKATYCEKITKQDGLIKEKDSPETIVSKVRAFTPWPGAYFFTDERGGKRIIITDAEIKNGLPAQASRLVIKRIKPEGKNEMRLEDYLRGEKDEKIIKKLSKYI